jgi:hypothetical protein
MNNKKVYKFNQRCCIIGRCQLIGAEDAVALVNHTKTVRCISDKGILLQMEVKDFFQRIKQVNEQTWKFIQNSSYTKELFHQ